MRALAHWAVRQIDPALTDAQAFDVIRIGGPRDGGLDAIWLHSDGKRLCLAQIKGSHAFLRQETLDVDDDRSEPKFHSFDGEAVDDLRKALDKVNEVPPPKPSDRLLNAIRLYAQAKAGHKKVVLCPIVFGFRARDFERGVEQLIAYLETDRGRFNQHSVQPFDIVGLGELLDQNFESPPGAVQVPVAAWPFGPEQVKEGTWIGLVPAKSLVDIRTVHQLSIYNSNFRYQLRHTPVRDGMWATLSDTEDRKFFHLYHNGITVLGRSISCRDQQLRMHDFQVVNGLQTIETLFDFDGREEGAKELQDVFVLTRLIDLDEHDPPGPDERPLDERIAEYSNRQNPITNRDLRSNDRIQKRLQHEIDGMGFKFQRKRGQYPKGSRDVVDNEDAAQRMLSFWRGLPADAKASKKLLFVKRTDDRKGYYEEVFPDNLPAEAVLIPWFVYKTLPDGKSQFEQEVVEYGDMVMLAMLGSLFKAKYRISLRVAPKRAKVMQAFLGEFQDGDLDAPLKRIWGTLAQRLGRIVRDELGAREAEAKAGGRIRKATVRNVLVNFSYPKFERKLLPVSVKKSLSGKLPPL